MSEASFFQDDNVRITSARAILGDKTYAMANVTSVSLAEIPPGSNLRVILVIGGLVLLFFSVPTLLLGFNIAVLGSVALGLGITVLGARTKPPRPKYVVRIGSASGESNALVSENREYSQKIVNAINEAIIARG